MIVLTGKTASGKDTIAEKLLLKYPSLKRIITTTSRTLRKNETHGIDYYFISREEFEKKIKAGEFTEYVQYGGNLYGTYKKELEKAQDKDLLWRIDPSRAGVIKSVYKNAVVIYITCDDLVILQRLKNRGLSGVEIKSRMEDDRKIWEKYQNNYDYIIENIPGKLEEVVEKISQIIQL